MKTIFNKPSKFLKYAGLIMCFTFLLGLIFTLTFGYNTSPDYGKVYEVTIYCFDETKLETYEDTAKMVLKDYGYSASEAFVEERTECDAVVLRYPSSSQNNALKIQASIVEKLEINENLVKVESLTLSSQKGSSIKLLITLGVLTLVAFIYSSIRFGWKTGVVLVALFVSSAILPLSIIAFSRIALSVTTINIIAIFATISVVLYMAICSKIKAITNQQEKPLSFRQNYLKLTENNKLKVVIPTALIVLVLMCLVFTLNRTLIFVGLSGVIGLLVSAFNLILFAPALQMVLNHEKEEINELR